MKHFHTIICGAFCALLAMQPLLSQEPPLNIDSLQRHLSKTSDKAARAELIFQILANDRQVQNGEALAKEGIWLAKALDDQQLLSGVYVNLGYILGVTGKVDSAIHYFNKAVEAAKVGLDEKQTPEKRSRLEEHITTAYTNLNTLYLDSDDFNKAVSAVFDGMAYAEENKIEIPGSLYAARANLYWEMHELDKAETYYRKAVKAAKKPAHLNTFYFQLAQLLNKKAQLDSSKHYFSMARKMAEERGDPYITARSINGLAKVALSQENWAAAVATAEEALDMAKENQMDIILSQLLSAKAEGLLRLGKLDECLETAKAATAIGESVGSSNTYNIMQLAYAEKKQFEAAYRYLYKYHLLKDSSIVMEKLQYHDASENRFLLQKKEADNLALLEKNAQQKRQNILIFIALLLALIAAGLLYNGSRRKHAYNEKLQSLLQELERTNTDLAKDNLLKNKLISIVTHNVSGPLKFIGNVSGLLEKNAPTLPIAYLQQKLHNIHITSDELTYVISNIMAWVKSHHRDMVVSQDQLDLRKALLEVHQLYQGIADEKSISLRTEAPETTIHTDQHILAICLQNLVHNALKYTKQGGTVSIIVSVSEGQCKIAVTDTGVGMTNERVDHLLGNGISASVVGTQGEVGYGLGLLIVREMMEKLDGKLNIESELGIGTKVVLTIPMAQVKKH